MRTSNCVFVLAQLQLRSTGKFNPQDFQGQCWVIKSSEEDEMYYLSTPYVDHTVLLSRYQITRTLGKETTNENISVNATCLAL